LERKLASHATAFSGQTIAPGRSEFKILSSSSLLSAGITAWRSIVGLGFVLLPVLVFVVLFDRKPETLIRPVKIQVSP